jgi:GTP-binding protein EngB required for normal cell division
VEKFGSRPTNQYHGMASETHLVPLEFDDLSPYLEQINTEIKKVFKELDKIKDSDTRSSSEIPRENLETRVEHLNNTIMSMCSEKLQIRLGQYAKLSKK